MFFWYWELHTVYSPLWIWMHQMKNQKKYIMWTCNENRLCYFNRPVKWSQFTSLAQVTLINWEKKKNPKRLWVNIHWERTVEFGVTRLLVNWYFSKFVSYSNCLWVTFFTLGVQVWTCARSTIQYQSTWEIVASKWAHCLLLMIHSLSLMHYLIVIADSGVTG